MAPWAQQRPKPLNDWGRSGWTSQSGQIISQDRQRLNSRPFCLKTATRLKLPTPFLASIRLADMGPLQASGKGSAERLNGTGSVIA